MTTTGEPVICGYLINGDPARPCAKRAGHADDRNRYHRDAATIQLYSARLAQNRAYWYAIVDAIKLAHGCERCGYRESAVALDFDHRDPVAKVTDVSVLVKKLVPGNAGSERQFLEEVRKCRILCSNCHRIRTHRPDVP